MKKTFLVISMILFAALTFAQNSEMDPQAAEKYNEGNKMLKAGNFAGALENYDAALSTSQDYRIYYQKGVTLKKLHKYEDAIGAFKSAIENNPDFSIAYNGLGGTYFVTGQYQEAIDAFNKFGEKADKASYKAKANEYIARAYTKLGEDAKRDGNYSKAIEHLKNAVDSYDYDAAYLLLAEAYVETANYEGALEAADKALNNRKSISKGGPFYYKGLAFKKMGDNAKAKDMFEEGRKDSKYKSLCDYELKLM